MTRNEAVKPGAIRPQRQLQRFQKAQWNLFTSSFFFWEAFGERGLFFFFFSPVLIGTWHQDFLFYLQILTLCFWSLIFWRWGAGRQVLLPAVEQHELSLMARTSLWRFRSPAPPNISPGRDFRWFSSLQGGIREKMHPEGSMIKGENPRWLPRSWVYITFFCTVWVSEARWWAEAGDIWV